MSALLKLAERCEAATEPCSDLDTAIVRALGFRYRERQYSIGLTYGKDWDLYTAKEWVRRGETLNYVPTYTSSLDAAMTLAPKGRYAMVIRQAVDSCLRDVRHIANAFEQRLPAFICAAALRALASAGEAGTATTVKQGVVHEHAAPIGETPRG